MNNNSIPNFGGGSIIPSTRKSIHCHPGYCPFAFAEAMGRYGYDVPSRDNFRNSPPLKHSHDEVDNAMSKLHRAYSPSPPRRKINPRKNSLPQNVTNDLLSEDNHLSKSLPETLLAYSSDGLAYSSDDESPNNEQNKSNQSQNTDRSYQKQRDTSFNDSQEYRSTYRSSESDTNHKNGWISTAVMVAAAAILIAFTWLYHIPSVDNKIYDETQFSIDLSKLGEKYRISQNSILQVQSGIATIFDREDTGSFIFVYDSESQNFNKVHFENFISDVASTAAKYLRNHSTNVHHIVLESKYLNMRSHSDLMNLYRKEVDKTGVMLVKELENVPSNLAMAFHYYCDEYNPLVKKSAIFFTLDLGKCTSSNTGQKLLPKTSHGVIEKCLTNKWQSVPLDNIKPLLTRVVNIVVDVYSLF